MAVLKLCIPAVLVVLGCCWNSASGCMWMKSNFQDLSNRSMFHLQEACTHVVRHGNRNLEFPYRLYSHVTELQAKDHLLFILRVLKHVMRLFEKSDDSAECDQKKLQTFIQDIHRQTTEIEGCATKTNSSELNKKIIKKMEIHFRGLISHLKHTDHSASGWRDVVGIIQEHLRRLALVGIKTKLDPNV
ncbi:interferon a3-like [Hoplias malabaricus]|uniref:interferon a3-like n=1 Tax=Hoplias malabaricus TaxID=27720 RepID=UPI00346341E3